MKKNENVYPAENRLEHSNRPEVWRFKWRVKGEIW
jgi:hypothetical protein